MNFVNLFTGLLSYSSSYGSSSSDAAAALAATSMMAAFGIFYIIFIGLFVLLTIALVAVIMVSNWKLFEKAGEPGWYAIIPFFNTFMMCKVVFGNAWWGCAFLAPLVCLPLFFIPFINVLVSFAVNMFVMFVSIMMHVRMALVFGRSGGVIALLILIPIVGYPVLAFGKETHYVPSEAKFF